MKDFSALGLELSYPFTDYRLVNVSMTKGFSKDIPVKINPTLEEIIANDNDLLVTDEDGIIRVVYATTHHFDVSADDEVIRLGFRPRHTVNPGELEFSLNGTGVIGDKNGVENEDAYLVMPRILVQGSSNDAQFEFTGYPNPFSDKVTLAYDLPENGTVQLKVYNAIGELVTVLVNENQHEGKHSLDFTENDLASGIYTFSLYFIGGKTSKSAILKMVH